MKLHQEYNCLKVFIIDEYSMLGTIMLEQLNSVFKQVFENNTAFEGLYVIFTGDFHQLTAIG
jgi:hypothetical protein